MGRLSRWLSIKALDFHFLSIHVYVCKGSQLHTWKMYIVNIRVYCSLLKNTCLPLSCHNRHLKFPNCRPLFRKSPLYILFFCKPLPLKNWIFLWTPKILKSFILHHILSFKSIVKRGNQVMMGQKLQTLFFYQKNNSTCFDKPRHVEARGSYLPTEFRNLPQDLRLLQYLKKTVNHHYPLKWGNVWTRTG